MVDDVDVLILQNLEKIQTGDDSVQISNALKVLSRSTKHEKAATSIYNAGGIRNLLLRLEEWTNPSSSESASLVLSVLANCALLSSACRGEIFKGNGINLLAEILKREISSAIINRVCRCLSNLSAEKECLDVIRQTDAFYVILRKLDDQGIDNACKESLLRALRCIVCSSAIKNCIYNDISLSTLFELLKSDERTLANVSLRTASEFIKQCAAGDLCRVLSNHEDIESICGLYGKTTSAGQEIISECLFILSSSAQMRVAVGRSGGIVVFCRALDNLAASTAQQHAIHGLCLCAREAFNRVKIKNSGALKIMVKLLKSADHKEFHHDLVTALVWFLFDDMSMAIMLRAGVVQGLLSYFNKMVAYESSTSVAMATQADTTTGNASLFAEEGIVPRKPERRLSDQVLSSPKLPSGFSTGLTSTNFSACSPYSIQSRANYCFSPTLSSPDTSPYDARSPVFSHYHGNGYSPERSPDFSSAASPPYYYSQSPPANDMEAYDSLSLGSYSPESPRSSSAQSPPRSGLSPPRPINTYHCQSADGTHAMIHGARGPVHDVFLLLSRLSQTSDPSTYLVNVQCFTAFMTYILLSPKPNPKCARLLNRLTLNPNCFETMISRRIVVRIKIRLLDGYSLESIARCLDQAWENIEPADNERQSPSRHHKKRKPESDDKSQLRKRICIDNAKLRAPENVTADDESPSGEPFLDERHLTCTAPTAESKRTGELLLSNLRAHTESSYGKGVLVHIMLTGSLELRTSCVLALPFLCRSKRLQHRLFVELKAFSLLMELLTTNTTPSECFVVTVEAIHNLSLALGLTFDKTSILQRDVHGRKPTTPADHEAESENTLSPSSILRESQFCPHEPLDPGDTTSCCDLLFRLSSDAVVYTNRHVIENASPVFRAMLSQQFSDASLNVIPLLDIGDEHFIALVHFIYGCRIDVVNRSCRPFCQFTGRIEHYECGARFGSQSKEDTAQKVIQGEQFDFVLEILKLAERFCMDDLKSSCESYLVGVLNAENAVEMYISGTWYHSYVLKEAGLCYMLSALTSCIDRVRCFAEVLHSIARKDFIRHLNDKISGLL